MSAPRGRPGSPDISGGPILLLVNPTSGHGRSMKLLPRTVVALEGAGFTPTVHITENLADATEHARAAAAGSIVAVLGGDGFLGASAAGAKESGAVLLPLAGGRGNDTVRRLGLALDPVKAIGSLGRLVTRDLDMGTVNGRPYLGVANVGFDGLANEYGNSARLNLGPFVYLYGGLKAFLDWKNVTFTLSVDGRQAVFPGWFVAVGNVGQYGGGNFGRGSHLPALLPRRASGPAQHHVQSGRRRDHQGQQAPQRLRRRRAGCTPARGDRGTAASRQGPGPSQLPGLALDPSGRGG